MECVVRVLFSHPSSTQEQGTDESMEEEEIFFIKIGDFDICGDKGDDDFGDGMTSSGGTLFLPQMISSDPFTFSRVVRNEDVFHGDEDDDFGDDGEVLCSILLPIKYLLLSALLLRFSMVIFLSSISIG